MKTHFESRFEEELSKIKISLSEKEPPRKSTRCTKRLVVPDKIIPPSIVDIKSRLLMMPLKMCDKYPLVKSREKDSQKIEELGRYFLRTSVNIVDEVIIWNVYRTIHAVESTFRLLKKPRFQTLISKK